MVMNQEDIIMITSAAVIGLLLGFLYGKHASRKSQNRNISQKLTQNEIERWRINPKFATLLMGKDPVKDAEDEYASYKILKGKNEDIIDEIEATVDLRLKEVVKLRSEYEKLESPIEKATFMENRYGIWTARIVESRLRTQNASNQLIAHAYNLEFLNFCRQGTIKPGIVSQMDNLDLDREIKNSHKKNWDQIGSITDSMFTDYQDEVANTAYLFGVKQWGLALVRSEISTLGSLSRANLSDKSRESNSNALRDAIGVLGQEVNKQSEYLLAESVETQSLEDSIIIFGKALIDFSNIVKNSTLNSLKHVMLADEAYITGEQHHDVSKYELEQYVLDQMKLLSNQLRFIQSSVGE